MSIFFSLKISTHYLYLNISHTNILFHKKLANTLYLDISHTYLFQFLCIGFWIASTFFAYLYFLGNVLVEVRIAFLPDYPLILSLLKHRGV